MLRPVLVPFQQVKVDVTTFQQDNARPHRTRLTRNFLNQKNVYVTQWTFRTSKTVMWVELKIAEARRQPAPRDNQELIQTVQDE